VAKRWLLWTGIWVAVSALAFLAFYWVVALAITIMGLVALVVALMSQDWDEHSTFEQREAERARKRKERYERGAAARTKDRARWEAHQAKKAGRHGA
jgi:hypothetical protein